ncbi:hypothetical protein F1880_002837 [Penicillium rolfsii]|nr:hypothetical protein F1880_002837 [Penicillium rolfsii]
MGGLCRRKNSSAVAGLGNDPFGGEEGGEGQTISDQQPQPGPYKDEECVWTAALWCQSCNACSRLRRKGRVEDRAQTLMGMVLQCQRLAMILASERRDFVVGTPVCEDR